MAGFNSYFNFAILYVALLICAIAISSLPRLASSNHVARAGFALSLPLWFLASHNFRSGPDFPQEPRWTEERQHEIEIAARADKQPGATKLLLFEANDWPEAVRVALALDRMRCRYRVDVAWELIFGRGRGVELRQALYNRNMAIWTVRSSGPDWLATQPHSVNPRGEEILFSTAQVNAKHYINWGWDISEGPYSFSVAKSAFLRFVPQPASAPVLIECDVQPSNRYQAMVVTFNDEVTKGFEITTETTAALEVPASVWNSAGSAVLKFDFPNAVSPLAAGVSEDPRELGCAFQRIRFRSVP
ncbi:MAG: hypothetical protein M3Y69_10005 [Verrucomicrobiota bacterium]|nr:hypothetical protein [Verrucomicrobiota bacterium]